MSKSSEDVLTIVNYVRNKKVVGELYMMSERLAWKPQTKSAFNVSHDYADIKGNCIIILCVWLIFFIFS